MIAKEDLKLVKRALENAEREIEAFEEDTDWYTASTRLMDQLEKAIAIVGGWLRE